MDTVKWIICGIIAAAGIYANSYFAGEYSVFIRAIALLALAAVVGVIAFTTVQGKSFWLLLKDARTEIRRVVWPTRQETTQTTLIVIVVVLIMSFILWLFDLGLNYLISKLIG